MPITSITQVNRAFIQSVKAPFLVTNTSVSPTTTMGIKVNMANRSNLKRNEEDYIPGYVIALEVPRKNPEYQVSSGARYRVRDPLDRTRLLEIIWPHTVSYWLDYRITAVARDDIQLSELTHHLWELWERGYGQKSLVVSDPDTINCPGVTYNLDLRLAPMYSRPVFEHNMVASDFKISVAATLPVFGDATSQPQLQPATLPTILRIATIDSVYGSTYYYFSSLKRLQDLPPATSLGSFPISVYVENNLGKPRPGYLVAFEVVSGNASIASSEVVTDDVGESSNTVTITGVGTVVVAAKITDMPGSPITFTTLAS